MLLTAAAQQLEVTGAPEDISIRTIIQDTQIVHGASVSFEISSPYLPKKAYKITDAFTAQCLGLAEHSYPIATLQKKYKHLVNLPRMPSVVSHRCCLVRTIHTTCLLQSVCGLALHSPWMDYKDQPERLSHSYIHSSASSRHSALKPLNGSRYFETTLLTLFPPFSLQSVTKLFGYTSG
ncbi:unnamed protein product [Knipowitschia caucasica]